MQPQTGPAVGEPGLSGLEPGVCKVMASPSAGGYGSDGGTAACQPAMKLVLVGDEAVGKTSFWQKFVEGDASQTNNLADGFPCKSCEVTLQSGKVQLWDTSGKSQLKGVTIACCQGSSGIIIIYDVTCRETFYRVPLWLIEVKRCAHPPPLVMLVGNKSDAVEERKVSYEDGYNLATGLGLPFLETCSLRGTGVRGVLQTAYDGIVAEASRRAMCESEPQSPSGSASEELKVSVFGIGGEVMLESEGVASTTLVREILDMVLARQQVPRALQLVRGTKVLERSAMLAKYRAKGQSVLELTCLKLQAIKLDPSAQEECRREVHFSIVGDQAVGKTCLMHRFLQGQDGRGRAPQDCLIELGDKTTKLRIWDGKFPDSRSRFVSVPACGVLVVYDITRRQTFYKVPDWIHNAEAHNEGDVAIVVVGNKRDLTEDRKVSYEEGLNLATGLGLPFVETSTGIGEDVNAAFLTTCEYAWAKGVF